MLFFLNLSTRAKLLSCFLVVILINLIVSVSTIMSLSNVQTNAAKVEEVLNGAFTRIYNTQISMETIDNLFSASLKDAADGQSIPNLAIEGSKAVQKLREAASVINTEALGTEAYRQSCTSLRDNIIQALNVIDKNVLPLIQGPTPKYKEAFSNYIEMVDPLFFVASGDLSSIFKQQNEYCINLFAQSNDAAIMYMSIVMTIVGAVVALALALLMSNYISTSLEKQIVLLQSLEKGDFSISIEHGHNDEFGKSQSVLRNMRNTLSDVLSLSKDESVKVQHQMRELQTIAQRISEVSGTIQSQAITVAAASDEMVSTTADIARNCETAAAGSNTCREITVSGVGKVREAVEHIRQQRDQTKVNASKIESLARQTNDIGSIVSTIDDIAAQTNLLALNAAIEAARAGEAGRGFAVVADEVRALASRTSASTQEISKMVKNIQDEASTATESINASVAHMDGVAEDAEHIMNVLNEINDHVSDVNTQITQIATAAEEQTAASDEISGHMQTITEDSSNMRSDAENQYSAMANTTAELNKLLEALEFFKMHKGHNQSAIR